MAGRQTRGRQRIPIRRIENQDDLYATFSKRRLGLYKKASELSTLCGVDIGIIIFSPTDNPFSFFHPNMESVVDRYRNPDQTLSSYARVIESHTRSKIEDLNRRLDEILEEKEQLKEHEKYLDEIDKTRQKGWWEETLVESLNKEQVKEWIAWFQAFKAQVESRIEDMKNGASTSAATEQQNPPNLTDVPGPSAEVGPSVFAPGPSYAPAMWMMRTEQVPSHYYGVLPQAQDPSSAGGSGQYFFPPLPQDPSAVSESGNTPGQFFFPPLSQGPFDGGKSGHVPVDFFFPPPSRDPSDGDGDGDRIPGQYFYPTLSQDPSGGGRSYFSGQYFYPPSSEDPSAGSHVPGRFFFPPPPQDTSAGGSGLIRGQFFLPQLPLNPSASGGSADPIPGQYSYIPPGTTRDSSAAGGSGELGSSDQGHGGN